MKIHQVRWRKNFSFNLEANSLSCFECKDRCTHYFLKDIQFADNSVDKLSDIDPDEPSVPDHPDIVPTQFTVADFSVDDFVVVNFVMEEQKSKSRRFIGCIKEIQVENEILTIKFLTPKPTRDNNGYVYTYPKIDDILNVKVEQIVKNLAPPKKILRGALLFDISSKEL